MALAVNAYADNRSLEQMKAIAVQHLAKGNKAKGNAPSTLDVKLLNQNDELAVMGNATGFVVIAVDDDHEPILGYSDNEYPTAEQNPAFYWWMENVQKALSLGIHSTAASAMPANVPSSVAPYCTALWNQSNPYNMYVPSYKSGAQVKHYPTGCVATAMAESMYYYKYPEHGTGLVRNAFDGGEGEGAKFVSIQLDTLHFDWDNMIPEYKSNYTAAQADAVAWLMYACGNSIRMGYSPSGSGAYTDKAYQAMVQNYGYSKSMPFYFRDMISVTEWNNAVYTNIAKKLPLITAGASPTQGGHCFILDGYDESGRVHVNWGWGGSSNGFFDLTLLDGYSLQQAFFPVAIEMEGEHNSMFGMYKCGLDIMVADNTHLRMNIPGYVYNIDPLPYSKDIYFVARDVNTGKDYLLATQALNGKEIEYITSYQELLTISKAFVTIVNKVSDGTFYVFAATKSGEESRYQPIRANENYLDCYLMKVENGQIASFDPSPNGWLTDTAIENVTLSPEDYPATSTATYNISGQRVSKDYRGITISNGRKVVVK